MYAKAGTIQIYIALEYTPKQRAVKTQRESRSIALFIL